MQSEANITTHSPSARNQLVRLIALSLGIFVIGLAPADALFNDSHSVCIHYRLLGIQCPLCGMTRAIHQLLHFNLLSAIQYNPVVALLPIYFGIDLFSYFKPEKRLILIRQIVFWLGVIALALLYAVRIAEGLS